MPEENKEQEEVISVDVTQDQYDYLLSVALRENKTVEQVLVEIVTEAAHKLMKEKEEKHE